MELSQLLSQVRYEVIQGTVHTRVAGVTNDTRDLKRGDVYVCIEGYDTDGHRFVPEAVKKGAPAIVTAKEIPCTACTAPYDLTSPSTSMILSCIKPPDLLY